LATQVPYVCGLLTVFFSAAPVRDYDGARAADRGAFARFHAAMLERGIYLPASPYEAWFPSLAHGEAEIEATLAAAGEAFAP
jgi:glutamate-1-semialdehyde 2,1-aminomutase